MDCPRDGVTLEITDHKGIEVDSVTECPHRARTPSDVPPLDHPSVRTSGLASHQLEAIPSTATRFARA